MTPENKDVAGLLPSSEGAVGIYVASRASVPERPAMWQGLRLKGWPIVSTWIDEAGEGETEDFGELWQRIHDEIASSVGVLLYAEADDFPLKGALVECGIALGTGKRVAFVLPHVALAARSMKPIGSWAAHPNARRFDDLAAAKDWLLAAPGAAIAAREQAYMCRETEIPCSRCTTVCEAGVADEQIAALKAQFGVTSNGRGIREFTQVKDFALAVAALASRPGAPVASGEDMVQVPRKFMQGFGTLAHNYSLKAVPPDYYSGTEGDAFSNAYRRCGQDLAQLRALIPVVAASPSAAAYQGPKKFTAEEIADGNRGIRWVTAEAVCGRPSSHDVMEYLKANKTALCTCEQCTAFFPSLASPSGAGLGGAVASSEAVEPSSVRQFLAALVIRSRDDCGMFPQVSNEVDADDAAYQRILKLIDFYYPRKARAALASQPGCAVEGEAE